MRLLGTIFLLSTLVWPLVPASAESVRPSFDCAKATNAAETLICGNENLAARDHWLDLAYRDALAVDPKRAGAIKADQLRWLRARNKLCGLKESELAEHAYYCLVDRYRERTKTLVKTTFGRVWEQSADDPKGALARLRPLHSPLATLFADILSHLLSGETVKDFANFSDDVAERLGSADEEYGVGNEDAVLPCRLAEKYPRLLLMGRAYFGSSKDLMLANFDCGETGLSYPKPVSQFLLNDPLTNQNWLQRCSGEGTIFHAYARDLRVHTLRLAHFPKSYLSDALTALEAPDMPWPTHQELTDSEWSAQPEYEAAKAALGKFYRQRFGLSAADGETAATRALWDNRNLAENPAACLGEE